MILTSCKQDKSLATSLSLFVAAFFNYYFFLCISRLLALPLSSPSLPPTHPSTHPPTRPSDRRECRDGASFLQLYNRIKAEEPTFVVVENMKGEVFGGFASSAWASGCQVR